MHCDSKTTCTCTANCVRHIECCECVEYHRKTSSRDVFSTEGENLTTDPLRISIGIICIIKIKEFNMYEK